MGNEPRNKKFEKLYKEAHKDKKKRGNDAEKTPKQRANERKQRRRRMRVKMALYLTIGAIGGGTLGGGGTIVANKLLNSPAEGVEYDKDSKELEINLDELQGELEVTGKGDKAKEFREQQARAAITEISREKAAEKIKNVEEPQDVLNIIEKAVAEYWEESYKEDVNNVDLHKDTTHVNIYRDTAQNGDEIKRFRTGGSDNNTVVTINIDTNEGIYTESYHVEYGFTRVYDSVEEVKEVKSNMLEECVPVVLEGIEYFVAMEQNILGKTSDKKLEEYEKSFQEELAKGYDIISQTQIFGKQQSKQENVLENVRED